MADEAARPDANLRLELDQTRAALENLIDRGPLGVHRWDLQPDGRLLFAGANPAADRILGISHAALLGKTIYEAFPSLRGTEVPAAYHRVALTGEPYEAEQVSYRDDRIEGVFEITAFQTAPSRMAVLFRDITERRKMEMALRESEGRLQSIFRAAPIGIGVIRDRRIQEVNDTLCSLVGRSRDEIVGQSSRIFYADQAEFEKVGRGLYDDTATPGRGSGETRWVRADGRLIDVLLSASPLVPGSLEGGLTFTVLDITERKRAEEERRRLETRMLQTQKLESLGVLAGGIAHDFNNILMAVLGNADIAAQQLPPASGARESLQEIEKAARRAADLCRQMLAYSGKGRFLVRHLDLSEVILEMRHMLEISVTKKAMLRIETEPGLPPVEADVAQVRQIVMNLVINASEALGETSGVITIRTGVMVCDAGYLETTVLDDPLPPGRYVSLEVSDSGCGMDPQTRARIFEPFFTTNFTGRGLGLAAVLGIVRGHRGTVKVYSEPGKGSTFQVLLPAGRGDVDHLAASDPGKPAWSGSGTVLLVDDEEAVRSVGGRMLEGLGFRVLSAADGVEALAFFRDAPQAFTCVILDLTMPRMDGEETFREMRRIRPDIPILLSSGYNEQDVLRRFRGKGLAGFIQKPYQMSALSELLRGIQNAEA